MKQPVKQRLAEFLENRSHTPYSIYALSCQLEVAESSIRRCLKTLEEEGKVGSRPDMTIGTTVYYWRESIL